MIPQNRAPSHVEWITPSTTRSGAWNEAPSTPATEPTSRQAAALGLADVRTFPLASYRGPILLILNELKRAGALDCWAEDTLGNRVPFASPALNMRGGATVLTVFYRSPIMIAECPACGEIRQIVSKPGYCAGCDAVQPDGEIYQRVTPQSVPYPISDVPNRWQSLDPRQFR